MEIKFNNKYTEIYTDIEKSYIEVRRNPLTKEMTNDIYKAECKEWLSIIKKEKPKFQLVDDRNMKFIIDVDIQIWANKNLVEPAVKASIRKTAFLTSTEIFSQVSIEQTMGENKNRLLKIGYFDDEDKAKEWLFRK